jgi:hypothetical protein
MPNASGRRYKQALNKYRHIAARQRPRYRQRDAAAAARHLQKVIATERRIRQGAKKR